MCNTRRCEPFSARLGAVAAARAATDWVEVARAAAAKAPVGSVVATAVA